MKKQTYEIEIIKPEDLDEIDAEQEFKARSRYPSREWLNFLKECEEKILKWNPSMVGMITRKLLTERQKIHASQKTYDAADYVYADELDKVNTAEEQLGKETIEREKEIYQIFARRYIKEKQ